MAVWCGQTTLENKNDDKKKEESCHQTYSDSQIIEDHQAAFNGF
jgi:hypothetical protein